MTDEQKRSTHNEVREALAELHDALSKEGELDRDLRTELEGAAAEIAQALERSSEEDSAQGDNRLSDTAQGLALQLEVSHPTLTDVLNRLTQQLANLGI
jgi:polyhydroxyalkanoate synthesis regulator phasin